MPRRFHLLTYSLVLLLFLTGVGNVCPAQQPADVPETRFGSIPDSLLQMQEYVPDPSAPFVYLGKELDISFEESSGSIVALLDYHVRIKIFDSSAREASLVAIPYYFENGVEQVENIQATTYTPEGERIPLQEDAIRTINVNSRYNVMEFVMPAVNDGVVMEYAYRIRRRYIEELPDFFLAHRAPTSLARVSITNPAYLRYKVVADNYDGKLHQYSEQIDTSSVAKIFTLPRPEPQLRQTWVARDIPAVEEEAYISTLDDYRARLKFQLDEFGIPRQKLENSWDFVVAQLRRDRNILEAVRRNGNARKLGRSIAKEFSDPETAQDSIFRYLNSRINFSGAKGPYSEFPDEPVLNGQPVDQAAINQTLLSMLWGAGIEAWPVLISTRDFGQINKLFPSFYQFNGQLVYSKISDRTYFMDASFEHSQPDLIPVDTYNETGLLLKEDSYSWEDISPANSVFAIDINMDGQLDAQGNLSGKVEAQHSGYPAQTIRRQQSNGEPSLNILQQAVFDGYADVKLSGIEFSDMFDYDQPVSMEAEFALQNYATSFSDGLQFRPMIVGYLMSNPFEKEERDLPVMLNAPERLSFTYRIRIPEDYTLGSGAENRSISLPGARLSESYEVEGQIVRYEFNIDITRKRFGPGQYPQLLDLYKRWVELSNSTWLIKKR